MQFTWNFRMFDHKSVILWLWLWHGCWYQMGWLTTDARVYTWWVHVHCNDNAYMLLYYHTAYSVDISDTHINYSSIQLFFSLFLWFCQCEQLPKVPKSFHSFIHFQFILVRAAVEPEHIPGTLGLFGLHPGWMQSITGHHAHTFTHLGTI